MTGFFRNNDEGGHSVLSDFLGLSVTTDCGTSLRALRSFVVPTNGLALNFRGTRGAIRLLHVVEMILLERIGYHYAAIGI